jgi:hypothetical protein
MAQDLVEISLTARSVKKMPTAVPKARVKNPR